MARIHPFKALRPLPEHASEIACVPYDVIDTAEARQLAEGKPLSFLHVVRPEIDLPAGTDEHAPEVYEKGAENLRAYRLSSYSLEENEPALYVYRLTMDGRGQTGIFACVPVVDYDRDVILKHEKTRPAKEEDRTRHILAQQAHAEPVMLAYRGLESVNEIVGETVRDEPIYDFKADDGVRHTIWRVVREDDLEEAFRAVDRLYVADGHHRCKAASRAAAELRRRTSRADGEFERFPAVLFPMEEMRILAYNRVVRHLPVGPAAFLDGLPRKFEVGVDSGLRVPEKPGTACLYLDGRWHTLALPESDDGNASERLDVARLSRFLLEPELGITDPRTDPNLDFVGGIRGAGELERLVNSGEAELAISLFPTSMEDLLAVSDAGLLMPPKSTWFEPKLRSGLLVHLFDGT